MSNKGPVCVTGAGGFLGSHIVCQLLKEGYTVRGMYDNAECRSYLLDLPGAKTHLQLFPEDLLDEDCFDEAFEGCVGVIHTSSPLHFKQIKDPEEELLRPAQEGTINVLKACRSAGVETVVMTSSIMAAVCTKERPAHGMFTEDEWSDTEMLKSNKKWYHLSKTIAEDAAWHFMDEADFRLVTILPGMMFGPLLFPSKSYSALVIQHYLNGERRVISNKNIYFVDVRDVAKIHILALENQSVTGRLLANGDLLSWENIVTALRRTCDTGKIPSQVESGKTRTLPKVNLERLHTFFGLTKFRNYEHSVDDTVHALIKFGMVQGEASSVKQESM